MNPPFKQGDLVTHPWTGDRVWKVIAHYSREDQRLQVQCEDAKLWDYAANFTRVVPPRPTEAEMGAVVAAYLKWALSSSDTEALGALAEAATALAERLAEEAGDA